MNKKESFLAIEKYHNKSLSRLYECKVSIESKVKNLNDFFMQYNVAKEIGIEWSEDNQLSAESLFPSLYVEDYSNFNIQQYEEERNAYTNNIVKPFNSYVESKLQYALDFIENN